MPNRITDWSQNVEGDPNLAWQGYLQDPVLSAWMTPEMRRVFRRRGSGDAWQRYLAEQSAGNFQGKTDMQFGNWLMNEFGSGGGVGSQMFGAYTPGEKGLFQGRYAPGVRYQSPW